jgi:signal transduction histidine kinase/ActR/RegA family two-component response regulator
MRTTPDVQTGSHDGATPEACGPEALARRKDELEMVLGAAGIGACRVNKELAIVACDSQFKALFGLAPDAQPQWSDVEKTLASEDRDTLQPAIDAAMEHEELLDLAVRTTWSELGPRWVFLRGRVLHDARGQRVGMLLVARDATEEQRTMSSLAQAISRERRARHEAEAANRSKDEFLSVISHELRSPLNAILGWNRILAIKRSADDEVQAVAPRIEQSAKAQLKMVNDLLDLGRIGTGKLRITMRPLRLSATVALAVDAARPPAAAKGVQLTSDLHGSSALVNGDPDRLAQVVANLLSNAIKFTAREGRITVRLREAAERVVLSVTDTGQGISADLLPHIFDRFRQGDSSTTRGAGGLGLGLTLVREIVALHSGTVSAHSDGAGRGATFEVTLPLASAATNPSPLRSTERSGREPRLAAEQLAGLSILVVDDEADARAVLAETLRLEGATVTVGDSARAAFAHLRAHDADFDVLITDIGMPEEDGYSLVRRMRRLTDGERVVAIALTGYAARVDVEAAIDAGFDLHVPKPVDFDSLVPIIRRLAATR